MSPEVFGQLTDTLAQQSDLNFGAAGIGGVGLELLNDVRFLLSG